MTRIGQEVDVGPSSGPVETQRAALHMWGDRAALKGRVDSSGSVVPQDA
jgi:hypothetical protein